MKVTFNEVGVEQAKQAFLNIKTHSKDSSDLQLKWIIPENNQGEMILV